MNGQRRPLVPYAVRKKGASLLIVKRRANVLVPKRIPTMDELRQLTIEASASFLR